MTGGIRHTRRYARTIKNHASMPGSLPGPKNLFVEGSGTYSKNTKKRSSQRRSTTFLRKKAFLPTRFQGRLYFWGGFGSLDSGMLSLKTLKPTP